MTKKLVIANWKCNKTTDQSVEWVDKVGSVFQGSDDFDVVVCPPFTALAAVSQRIRVHKYPLYVGAQSVSQYDSGAYTGEVSARMVAEFATHTLIGHSERRQYFHETNQEVDQKVDLSLQYGITPVVLVRDEKDKIPERVMYFAWEPVSAIGTGNFIDPQIAGETVEKMRSNNAMRIGMYGGSVNKDTIGVYMSHPNIYGVVVGSASFEADSFLELLHAIRSS